MAWSTDPELQRMFIDEVGERAANLLAGAQAVVAGTVGPNLAGSMAREGHTIKGTSKVLGYDGIARAGLVLEIVWKALQSGELDPTERLGEALHDLADVLPGAIDDPALLEPAVERVRAAVADTPVADALPDPPVEDGPGAVVVPLAARRAGRVDDDPGAGSVGPTDEDDGPPDDADDEAEEGRAEVAGAERDDATDGAADDVAEVSTGKDAEPEPDPAVDPAERSADAEAPEAAPQPPRRGGDADRVPIVIIEDDGSAAVPASPPRPPAPPGVGRSSPSGGAGLAGVPEGLAAAPAIEDPAQDGRPELGGLLSALQTWARGESVSVSAGMLYRLINDVAGLHIEVEAVRSDVEELLSATERLEPTLVEPVVRLLDAFDSIWRAVGRLEDEATRLAAVPVTAITNPLPQLVRYLGRRTGKEVVVEIVGDEALADRQVLDRIGDAVRQLVVNSVLHGIEPPEERGATGKPVPGIVAVAVDAHEGKLTVSVSDDGRGIDWEAVRLAGVAAGLLPDGADPAEEELRAVLTHGGITSSVDLGELAGDGDGLARVRKAVEDLHGTFTLDTATGRGTTVTLTVPTHRALQRATLVVAGGRTWGIPEAAVAGALPLGEAKIDLGEKGSRILWEREMVPLASFAEVVGTEPTTAPTHAVVVTAPTGTVAFTVEGYLGPRDIAAKELGPLLSGVEIVVGAALLGGDEVVLLVDPGRLAEDHRRAAPARVGPVRRVLVVDDSRGVQQVVGGILASSGFAVATAGSVAEALAALSEHPVDAVVVDFSMPRADGVALVHMVRQRYGDLPVIMLSGVAGEEERRRAEKAGVDAFFDKGDLREGALTETVRLLIEERSDAPVTPL